MSGKRDLRDSSRGESVRRESKRGKSGEMIKKLSPLFDFPFRRGGGADDVASEHRKILMGSPLSRSNLYCAVKRCRCNLSFKNGGHGAPLRASFSSSSCFSLRDEKKKKKKISRCLSDNSNQRGVLFLRCSAAINHASEIGFRARYLAKIYA